MKFASGGLYCHDVGGLGDFRTTGVLEIGEDLEVGQCGTQKLQGLVPPLLLLQGRPYFGQQVSAAHQFYWGVLIGKPSMSLHSQIHATRRAPPRNHTKAGRRSWTKSGHGRLAALRAGPRATPHCRSTRARDTQEYIPC